MIMINATKLQNVCLQASAHILQKVLFVSFKKYYLYPSKSIKQKMTAR